MWSVAHLKINEKLSLLKRFPVDWHALVLNTFNVTVLDYFTLKKKEDRSWLHLLPLQSTRQGSTLVHLSSLPGCELMMSILSSNVWIVFLKPHRASASLMFIFIVKSVSFLWNKGCSFWSRTIITSPGSNPGSWSPSPVNVIFWPSLIPVQHMHLQFSLQGQKCVLNQLQYRVKYDHLIGGVVVGGRLTFINVNFKNFLLPFYFASVAVLAAVFGVEFLALSLTFCTHALDLLNHPWANLLHLDLHSSSFATWALLQGTFLTSVTCINAECSILNIINKKYHVM